ncbi:NAD-dependent deacetylase 2 [Fusarium odoratissimum]|uniref:NAD-dependent deacetylase 2 n=1 Tax=Fusarium oxysporum f. sp. cubense (strain race 4) TaxID=2502994 RepID=N1RXV4_FUSC4|nr:NAD-dependent deacetylase 2 [Fusarium odoratissimum]
MSKPLLRIPYTDLPLPSVIAPASASTLPGAIAALHRFFVAPSPSDLPASAVVLTGAGLSVASGLADYRGVKGTYKVNKTYRPIYYPEFLKKLHGYLRAVVCTSCKNEFSRYEFQEKLATLNPKWAELLERALKSGALDTEDPVERRFKGLKVNPDGDVDLPDAPYTTFRYPSCPKCLSSPPKNADGHQHVVQVDTDGAWKLPSTAGILKPAVVMFGESIDNHIKHTAEEAIDNAGKLLVVGTSLATYSAWRLVKRAQDRGMPIAIISMGGIRGEDKFFAGMDPNQEGEQGVRVALSTDDLLPALLSALRNDVAPSEAPTQASLQASFGNRGVFKDMLS